jgi:hypothetical protein
MMVRRDAKSDAQLDPNHGAQPKRISSEFAELGKLKFYFCVNENHEDNKKLLRFRDVAWQLRAITYGEWIAALGIWWRIRRWS